MHCAFSNDLLRFCVVVVRWEFFITLDLSKSRGVHFVLYEQNNEKLWLRMLQNYVFKKFQAPSCDDILKYGMAPGTPSCANTYRGRAGVLHSKAHMTDHWLLDKTVSCCSGKSTKCSLQHSIVQLQRVFSGEISSDLCCDYL